MFFVFLMVQAKPSKKGVHSVAAFEALYKKKVAPFNKISDTTFQRLKTGIFFDENGTFRGFEYIGGLRKELTYEEYLIFNGLILGYKQEYNENDKEQYDKRRNR